MADQSHVPSLCVWQIRVVDERRKEPAHGNMWEFASRDIHACTLKNAKICARQQGLTGPSE